MSTVAVPSGYHARPAKPDDIEQTVALLNVCERQFADEDEYSVDSLRVEWTLPAFDLERDGRVVATEQGRIVGYVGVFASAPYLLMRLMGAVHPDHRGRGLGSALLAWGEQRAAQHVAAARVGMQILVRSIVDVGDEPGQRLLEERDYHRVRYFVRMLIALDAPPPAPVWPPGIGLRTLALEDELPAGYDVFREVFRDHWGWVEQDYEQGLDEVRHWMTSGPDCDPDLYWLAMDGDQIAGICFCWPTYGGSPDLGFVGILGVRRPWRRRGIARALLLHAFNEYGRRKTPRVFLFADAANLTGATKLYEQVGMHVARRYAVYDKELRPGERAYRETLEA